MFPGKTNPLGVKGAARQGRSGPARGRQRDIEGVWREYKTTHRYASDRGTVWIAIRERQRQHSL